MRGLRELRDNVLRAVSLVVTDRRWAAPLSAMALGFGLFLGVAIGPGTAGGLATGASQIVAVAPSAAEEEGEAGDEGDEAAPVETEAEPFEEVATLEPEPVEAEIAPETIAPEAASEEDGEENEEVPPAEPEPEEEGTETQQLQGTVVHLNPAAGSYTMSIAGGELVSVHAAKLPSAGSKLTVEGTPLVNNTFAEAERERAGGTGRSSLRGVVTWVDSDPTDPAYTLSGRGSSILVQVEPAEAPQLPALGAYATVAVAIQKPAADPTTPLEAPPAEGPAPEAPPSCPPDPTLKPPAAPAKLVVQRELEVEAGTEPATYLDLAGVVSAICAGSGQLLLSADDLRLSEDDVLLTVPKSIKTRALAVGDSVVATATVEADGSLTLAGLASNEKLKGAEDAAAAQGDLKR